jgi:ribosomal protein L11 methyltransferase
MRHVKVSIASEEGEARDILIAVLSETGYDGFEEETGNLYAYIPEPDFDADWLADTARQSGFTYSTETIEPQNWNEVWESGFDPVVVEGFCTIRAHFHGTEISTPYVVVITPKMSFGTGHHATTQLMMMGMSDIDFAGKSVLDFGTGTGVLAILAGMLGATDILGIDNDEWAVNNAIENLARNDSEQIAILQASITDIPEKAYDVVLANINRHILLQYMNELFSKTAKGGQLLMSGLLTEDEEIITESAKKAGFSVISVKERAGWISILCHKYDINDNE